MKPSTEAVLDLIRRLDGACPQDFAEQIHTARYSARVMELRNLGYTIVRERCIRHPHRNFIELYRLVGVPDAQGQLSLVGGS